ncbi:MAG: hypothetical protein WD045_08120 [Pirellulaceae bacterium]
MLRFNFAVGLLFVGILGCGAAVDDDRPHMVPVTAVVTYEGKPIQGASVTFASSDSRGAVGRTDKNGAAVMWTFEAGDGVIPGDYEVSIRKLEVLALPDPETVSPEEYNRISREMNAALAGDPKHLIPKRYSTARESGLVANIKDQGKQEFTFDLVE